MKLALVHDWLTGMRGGEKCLAALCRRFPQAELFTLLHARGRLAPEIERMRITTSFLQRVPMIDRHYRYWLPGVPHVCYCFTPMRYAWQLRGDYFADASAEKRLLSAMLNFPKRTLSTTRN